MTNSKLAILSAGKKSQFAWPGGTSVDDFISPSEKFCLKKEKKKKE